jgi:hypothetical protein
MSLPEADVMVSSVTLGEHDTTGLLPVGFEFERLGSRYDHFDVSTDGFITFVRGPGRRGLPANVRLVDERARLGAGRVSYRLRGCAPRRRLVVAITEDGPVGIALEVTVHERTGIVEVRAGGQSFGEPTIRQLDRAQSSPSRVNSARKIG